jgi:DNA-nicking Smr family endonuclease
VTRRTLTPHEAALWAKVMATVRPIAPKPKTAPAPAPPSIAKPPPPPPAPQPKAAPRKPVPRPVVAVPKPPPSTTLDGGWDRRLSRGLVSPESEIDLHGHTLATAHARLDQGLERAIQRGDRVLLLVTGKPPRPESERPHARGAIRAAVGDWIAGSRHADRIAAVRGAHPRHGGTGALYIILRRPRAAFSEKS